MVNKLTANVSTVIDASSGKVWQALTDPSYIKQYLFGTNAVSDWKKGSAITYSGEWEGKKYQDKGTIVDIIPEKLLHTTYFSSMSGKEDKPENYANVIYSIGPEAGGTLLTISQDNINDEAQLEHMNQNWNIVLQSIKKLLEK